MRRLLRLCLTVLSFASLGVFVLSGLVILSSPLIGLTAERTIDGFAARIERALAREVDQAWVDDRLAVLLAAEERDWDDIILIETIAEEQGIAPSAGLVAQRDALFAEDHAPHRRALDCVSCSYDPANCESLGIMMACNLPLELFVVGDVTALGRNGIAYASGGAVDRLETGLAIVGLGSTAALVVTGGSSATVKAGATALRVAARMGRISRPFRDVLVREARALNIRWGEIDGYVVDITMRRGADIERVVDGAALERLRAIASDVGAISEATGPVETFALLRYVDTTGDLSRMRRVSEAVGPRTQAAYRVLGKQRLSRLAIRASDAAIAMASSFASFILSVIGSFLSGMNSVLMAALRRRAGPRENTGREPT
ncbi:MAG: hypothetical protein ACPGID_11570 [Rubricella sp.]